MRRFFVFAVALALACGGPAKVVPGEGPAAAPSAIVPGARSPVVVALVVDQFSAWVAEERIPELPKDGFFARLAREGTWARRMRYPYAITDTAPGHASLHTGKTPNESRILVNHNPDDKTGARISYFRDPATKLVTPEGATDVIGSSARPLAVETVADRLRAARPDAKILSFSLKDRAALLPAGKKPTHAIWFEPRQGSFATSTAIEPSFPSWAKEIGSAAAVKRVEVWDTLDREWLAARAGKDDAPGEGDLDGLGTTFPHEVTSAYAFRATPFGDAMIAELALAGVKAEYDGKSPLLVLVSMSGMDVVGHAFGPSSWEAWEHLRRLDATLAKLLREIEAITGPVALLLSGDHGNTAMPEARSGDCSRRAADPYDRPCAGGGRLVPDALRVELRADAETSLGRTDVIAGVSDSYVFLTAAGRALEEKARATLDASVRRVLATKHGADVAEVYDVRDLAKQCPDALAKAKGIPERARATEPVLTLVCRSWAPGAGAGDYFVVPAHGSFFDGEIVPGKGTSHGTPYLYDRTVPLFVRGPNADAGAVIDDPIDFTAYSAIEASFLGLDPRPARAILEALRAR